MYRVILQEEEIFIYTVTIFNYYCRISSLQWVWWLSSFSSTTCRLFIVIKFPAEEQVERGVVTRNVDLHWSSEDSVVTVDDNDHRSWRFWPTFNRGVHRCHAEDRWSRVDGGAVPRARSGSPAWVWLSGQQVLKFSSSPCLSKIVYERYVAYTFSITKGGGVHRGRQRTTGLYWRFVMMFKRVSIYFSFLNTG